MNVYHMSYMPKFVGERMVSLSFRGCNFKCIGCVRKLSELDIYAEESEAMDFSLDSIMRKLDELKPHRIYLDGYEPTLDPDLVDIVRELSKLDAHLTLMTNGSLLTRRYVKRLKEAGLNEVIIGVKSFDPEKHLYYTKYPLEPVLRGIENVFSEEDADFRLTVETLLLPGINDPEDIENLAKFLAKMDKGIRLFIDPWIPTVKEFREPTKEELIEAVSRAMRHLYVVSYHPLHSEVMELRKTPRKLRVVNFVERA